MEKFKLTKDIVEGCITMMLLLIVAVVALAIFEPLALVIKAVGICLIGGVSIVLITCVIVKLAELITNKIFKD